ncbi:hypothetical protein HDU93_003897 [Gonapodya sp. JEL0774]|nr:hypothetical protein HDU93_003897 [Gonapodya sp. JEL0774]
MHRDREPISPIETLPPEILHRIFRLLSPRTFYVTLPSISRRFRDVSSSAIIPGCARRAIGVQWTIEIRRVEEPDGCLWIKRWEDVSEFEACEGLGRDTGTIWTCLSALIELSPAMFADIERAKMEVGESDGPALLESYWPAEEDESGLPPLKRVKFTVSNVCWDIHYMSPDLSLVDDHMVIFEHVLEFVRNVGVRAIELGWQAMEYLDKFPAQFEGIDCVRKLMASAAAHEDNASKLRRAATLLRIFPMAHELLGPAFCSVHFDATSAIEFNSLVSKERRALVTKLYSPTASVSLLNSLGVFCNLNTLGVLNLSSGIKSVLYPSGPASSPIHTLFLTAFNTHLLSLQKEDIVSFTTSLIDHMPHLKVVAVTIVVIGSFESSKNIATLLGTMTQLLSQSKCKLQISTPISPPARGSFSAALSTRSIELWPTALHDWDGHSTVTVQGGKVVRTRR